MCAYFSAVAADYYLEDIVQMLNFMPTPDARKKKRKNNNSSAADDMDDDDDAIATVEGDDVCNFLSCHQWLLYLYFVHLCT